MKILHRIHILKKENKFKLIINIKLYIIFSQKVQMFVIMSSDLMTLNIIESESNYYVYRYYFTFIIIDRSTR